MAWLFEDERTPAVMGLLQQAGEFGAVAPLLWPLEALNGLLVAQRRQRISAEKRAEYAGVLRRLPVVLDDELADRIWDDVSRLAVRFGLTMYDATYLELALRRSLPLATLDRDLRRAGEAIGLELLGL